MSLSPGTSRRPNAKRLPLRRAALFALVAAPLGAATLSCTAAPAEYWSPTGPCGTTDSTVVPAGVTSMTVTVEGAKGGNAGAQGGSPDSGLGSRGGSATSTFTVTPGQTISATVGCEGGNGENAPAPKVDPSAGWSSGGGAGRGRRRRPAPGLVGRTAI